MVKKQTKYIFVTGGVLSGVGKGISAASIGNILKARSLKVNIQKCDQYLNVDAGTLNPAEHGECYVTKDGAETDLDLGHYERFLDIELTKESSVMSGRVLRQVIEDERAGKYLGKTVQIVPHVITAMQEHILAAAKGFDVHIVEVGGTVGDIEGQAWIEAIRELGLRLGYRNCAYVHVVYLPYLGASKEFKTKPAQNAVKDLRNAGIVPNLLIARSEAPAPVLVKNKLSLFGGVPPEAIALLPNASSIYQVPLSLEEQGIGSYIVKHFELSTAKPKLRDWRSLNEAISCKKSHTVRVGVVAKYLDNEDTYFSVVEALRAAAWHHKVNLEYVWVDAEKIEQNGASVLKEFDGILVPGGFGSRGVEGMVNAAQYALESKTPYLGLCLGLQVAVVMSARRGGLKAASSSEVHPETKQPVVYIMPDQKGKEATGGTMRLGDYPAVLEKKSLARQLYGTTKITERHRHRYEVNRKYEKNVVKGGLRISGQSPSGSLVEFVEAIEHPFFIATQAHPEFRSRPNRPHPLFAGFINALKNSSSSGTIKGNG
ncbi:MAG TPA: CTP synthase [Candidatus Saccharibacteria bacterium]|nr:synthase [Patescibacteria group bacterium]HMS31611.1 CTP synthase [Candidatus Saccharibacteria bacterium]